MADTVKTETLVKELSEFIDDHRGIDTVALYIGDASSFTDYFVITSVSSWAHLKGLFREVKDFLKNKGIRTLHHQRIMNDDTWVLIDFGNIVVHLMDKEMRQFYELEKLWFSGTPIYQSSKSS
ncbi:MAG: ribosome silencing factor [Spirochaetia bacterium]